MWSVTAAILLQYCSCNYCRVCLDCSNCWKAHSNNFFLAYKIVTSWSSCPYLPATDLVNYPESHLTLFTSPDRKTTISCLPSSPAYSTSPLVWCRCVSRRDSRRSFSPAAFPYRTSDADSWRFVAASRVRMTFYSRFYFLSSAARISLRLVARALSTSRRWFAPYFIFYAATATSYSKLPRDWCAVRLCPLTSSNLLFN